ncbi:MAG: NAD(P)/FAD-dependent oxidoreductase [Bacteroidales bacterium]|jgi:all-trans-retinol 13,14-reductase|nr:NAD(P)/FAD-dependent oxidoreductase [Bacteroidales bacterium]
MKQTVYIIGAGLGGLFCGAILSKEGYHVELFERRRKTGGGLHQFRREGVAFDTGMHLVGAFRQGAVLNRLCSWLGIMDSLKILPEDNDCFEMLYVGEDNRKYCFPRGYDAYMAYLQQEFPTERDGIARYMQTLYKICNSIKLYNLELPDSSYNPAELYRQSAGAFIDSFTEDERLRALLAFTNPLYAGDRYHTPVYIHALINKFLIEGASQFIGGSKQLADALAGVICAHGGKIHTDCGVTRIEIEQKSIAYIETADGLRRKADLYISTIHPSVMFNLLDRSKLQRSYWQRIDSIPSTYSAFTLHIIMKPETFPFINHACYYLDSYASAWQHARPVDDLWPTGLMILTPPETAEDVYATTMFITCTMTFEAVKQWENTTVGKRGTEYEAFKRRCEAAILDKLERIFPGAGRCIQSVYSASPLTIRDYMNQKDGSLYGVKKDCENIALSHIPVRTKLNNLLLSGQNVNLHGILGVPLTAIHTCSELLGMNSLIEKINSITNETQIDLSRVGETEGANYI